jgi:hypothetical protein
MMSATSRRRFLQGAAAAAAAATVACGGTQVPTPPAAERTPTPPPVGGATGPTGGDVVAAGTPPEAAIAGKYINKPIFGDAGLEGKSASTFLLYGLLLVDFGGKEVLVPNSSGFASGLGVHPHTPKLWVKKSLVASGTEDGNVPVGALAYSFWNITNFNLTIDALDSGGAVLAPVGGDVAWRDDPSHPWTNRKWVRSMKELTNKDIIATRNDTSLVAARMQMVKGAVTAITPTTDHGRYKIWKATKYDGTSMVKATTDSMIWQREYTGTAAKYRITLTPMATGTAKVIEVTAANKALVAAVTSSMAGAPANPNELTDTRAFARLLVGGDPSTHPLPEAINAAMAAASGSDGHCEGGSN